jgi:Domain of unknown function (DUF4347)/Concanavalin A-like lectin/glucanases superfamily/Bacterial Ig domain/Domain of unknown function (DUF2341)/Cadherin domain
MRHFLNTFRTIIRVAPRHYSAIDAELLEDRILMSAMPMVDAALAIDESLSTAASPFPVMTLDSAAIFENQAITTAHVPIESSIRASDGINDAAMIAKRLELVFVNSNTPDYQSLLDDLLANTDSDRELEIYLLDAHRDGIEQISAILDGYSNIDAIHLVSHGENGALQLGQTWLKSDQLAGYAGLLGGWQSSLASNSDIMIYGCDLASDSSGRDLIEAISALTGADVAASVDDTGHRQWGANWTLEYHVGSIESDIAFSEFVQQTWNGKLAAITVSTFADVVDAGDGVLSLREAIIQANSGAGGDTIILSAGTYTLTQAGAGENNASTGDLDLRESISIVGATAATTIIDGNGLDRVFHVERNNINISLSELTIQGGNTSDNGGGIYVQHTGDQLNLSRVIITANIADRGAGIFNEGTINLTDVVVSNNGNNTTTEGGGLYNHRIATLERVSIHGNLAGKGGGVFENGNTLSITNTTISGNSATSDGGGIFNQKDIVIINSTIANNTSDHGGGIFHSGTALSLTNTIVAGNLATSSGTDIQGSIDSQGHNLIQSTSGASGFVASDITGANASLNPLADNGGFGQTHSLNFGSRAIGAGTLTGAPTVDGRNISRDVSVDIGAFEVQLPATSSTGAFQVHVASGGIQATNGAARGSQQAVAFDDAGNYVVAWSTTGVSGGSFGIRARRFSGSGVALTSEITVDTAISDDQQWAHVASDSDGNFVVTWTSSNQDGTPLSVYARRYSSNGTALSGEFLVHTTNTGNQSNSSIAMDSGGNFIIAWQGQGPGDTDGIFARRYTASGIAIDSVEFMVNTDTSRSHLNPSVAMNDNGSFVIAWDNNAGMRARLFNATLSTVTAEITLDSNSAAGHASVAMHSDGSFVATWRDTVPIFGYGVYAQRFDATGAAIGGSPIVVNASILSDQSDPSIAMDAAGNFIVVWEGNGTQSGQSDSSGVFGQKFNASGTKIGGEFRINTDTTGTQHQVSVAMIDLDNFVAVWSGEGASDSDGVFARQFGETNTAPTITSNGGGSNATISVNENTSLVTTMIATDADLLTYSIIGGADAARFTINGANGQLSFITSPNYESPTDADGNNIYNVVVQASDGSLTDTQTLAVTVANVNEAPAGVGENYTVQEDGTLTTRSNWFDNAWSTRKQISFNNAAGPALTNQVVLVTLNASNVDYSLTQNSGQDLRFVDTDGTLLDYEIETWNEAGTSTVWVRVPQINAASTTDSIWMYYGNISATAGQNATGVWGNSAQAILHLNGTLSDSSAQANTVTNSGTVPTSGQISNGRTFDGVDDEINLGSSVAVDDIFNGGGTVSAWIHPTGWGENGFGRIADKASSTFSGSSLGNGWALQVNGTNGSLIFEQGHSTGTGEWRTAAGTISLNVWQHITVTYDSSSTSNNPRIFINGVEVAVTETKTPTGTADSDAALDLKIGNYSMSPDRTFDGAIDEFQLHNIALTPDQILANFRSMSGSLVSEGSVQSGPGGVLTNDSDIDGNSLTAILGTGPTHQQSFTLNSDGSFTYIPVANYSGSDTFTYFVSDGTNTSGPITVSLTITAVNDSPTITSNGGLTNATISLAENITAVTTVTATDADFPTSALTYSLSGGTDQARFSIDSNSGALSFLVAPNFESPNDSDGNRTYEVIVTVSDGQGGFDTQTIVVTILDTNEFSTSAISDTNAATNTVNENSGTGTLVGITAFSSDSDGSNNAITYSLTNNAGGRFSINSTSGIVTVANGTLLNREANATHSITVRATSSDGSSVTRNFSVNIVDVDEFDVGSISDSNTATNSVSENAVNGATVGITASASDADATTNAVTYSLDNSAGGRFAIHSTSGIVTVANGSLLDYESSTQHSISVRATSQDGSISTRTFTIAVANSNDNPPVITSSNTRSIPENQTFVMQLTATDADLPAQSLSFSIIGGADDQAFEITTSNQLVLRRPPNFENPRDSNRDNIYSVGVRVSDGAGGTDTQLIHVTVTNINEAPVVLSPTYNLLQTDVLASVPGGVLVGASDPDGNSLVVSLVSTTSNGLLTFASDGSFTYTPGTDFLGIDSFTFEVSDGVGGVTQGIVSLVVGPGFIPPPQEIPQGTTIPEGGSINTGDSSSESSGPSRSTSNSESATEEAASSDSGLSGATSQITAQFQSPLSESTTPAATRSTASATSNELSQQAGAIRNDKVMSAVRLADSSIEYRIIREFARQASIRAAEQVALETIQQIELVLNDGLLWNDLDHLRDQIASVTDVTPVTLGTATGVASGLSVGYVMWLLRGGYIVAGVMAQLPAWGLIDPLPILSQLDDLDDDDDDSLASMVDKSNTHHDSRANDDKANQDFINAGSLHND